MSQPPPPRRVLTLELTDAAIGFIGDGEVELFLGGADLPIIPDNIRWALAVMYALRDTELSQLIQTHFDQECHLMRLTADEASAGDTRADRPDFSPPPPSANQASNLIPMEHFRKSIKILP